MTRRGVVLGVSYHFEVSDTAVRMLANRAFLPYVSLLLFPRRIRPPDDVPHVMSNDEMEVLFERLVEAALLRFWGPQGRPLRFGGSSQMRV